MSDLSGIFEIGKRALLAYRQALNTTAHNIANINTPGFSRQQAVLGASLSPSSDAGQVGTGVEVLLVRRLRDEFLDAQYRAESKDLGRWESLSQTLGQIEEIFLEPSESGLRNRLDEFWNGWHDLANDPENLGSRHSLIRRAESLTHTFHRLVDGLKELRLSLDSQVAHKVKEINSIAKQIAELNLGILTAEGNGNEASDLRDRRDLLLDRLSAIMDIKVIQEENGSISLRAAGKVLVEKGNIRGLSLKSISDGGITLSMPVWEEDESTVRVGGGSLKALMEARDDLIPAYEAKLNRLTEELVTSVNEIHSKGFGLDGTAGIHFFDPAKLRADNIALDGEIISDASKIAASSDGSPGDNSVAMAIAALKNLPRMEDGTITFNHYYSSLIAEIGAESKGASGEATAHQLLIDQLENRRESLKGVSLDEEMIDLIKFQRAYQAAARIVSRVDEIMDVILGMV